MPGMNKNSRTIQLIESSLHRLELDGEAKAPADALVIAALGVLDELRRLERKWREQLAAGSTRRIKADFRTLNGWYRRWLLASRAIAACHDEEATKQLRSAIRDVECALQR